jgi:Ni/Co efflux regulator RcnB
MKRFVLSALAASMLAASAISGQAAPLNAPAAPQSATVHVDWKKQPTHREVKKRIIIKKKVVRRAHWKRGETYRDWRKHERVDWRRHHLHRPGHGQQWVRVGNDYMLVSILSGVIAGIVAAH